MSITIDGTTGISGNNGSASTPAIQGEDTNTGVFFPAADTVAIATNGTERMRVVNGFFGGYVGINTTTPSAALNVASVGTSNVPTVTGAAMRIEQGPFGYSETVLQIAAGDQGYGGAGIHFGVGALAASTRIASFGSGGGLLIQENSGGPIGLWTKSGAFTEERMRITAAGVLQFNSGYGSVATAFGCRAWVNFNGTGTVAIRASGNVSSITDNGTGTYTVNFTTAMPDANYAWVASAAQSGGVNVFAHGSSVSQTASAFQVITTQAGLGAVDSLTVNISVFR